MAATNGSLQADFDTGTGRVERPLSTGDVIYVEDDVSTGTGVKTQILLKDQTVFIIGENSRILFETFAYDPVSKSGNMSVAVDRGYFKFISGKIAKANPENMTVRAGKAIIAVNGTEVVGNVTEKGSSVVLLSGTINVETNQGTEEIYTSGWGVDVDQNGNLQSPSPITDQDLETYYDALSTRFQKRITAQDGAKTETETTAGYQGANKTTPENETDGKDTADNLFRQSEGSADNSATSDADASSNPGLKTDNTRSFDRVVLTTLSERAVNDTISQDAPTPPEDIADIANQISDSGTQAPQENADNTLLTDQDTALVDEQSVENAKESSSEETVRENTVVTIQIIRSTRENLQEQEAAQTETENTALDGGEEEVEQTDATNTSPADREQITGPSLTSLTADFSALPENADTTNPLALAQLVTDDAENDITYELLGGNANLFTISEAGVVMLRENTSLNFEDVSEYSLGIRSSNALGESVLQQFIVNITDENDAPQLTSLTPPNGLQDNGFSYLITATDEDVGDNLSITANALPDWLSLTTNAEGQTILTGTPGNDDVGSETVTLEVSDGTTTRQASFSINIDNVNDLPSLAALEGISILDTSANDSFTQASGTAVGSDIDAGDTLTYALTNGESTSAEGYDRQRIGTYGTFFLNQSTGAYNFVPNDSAIEGLTEAASESFEVTVSDGAGGTTSGTVSVSLTGANDAPFGVSINNNAIPDRVFYPTQQETTDNLVGNSADWVLVNVCSSNTCGRVIDEPDRFRISSGPNSTTGTQVIDLTSLLNQTSVDAARGGTFNWTTEVKQNSNNCPGGGSGSQCNDKARVRVTATDSEGAEVFDNYDIRTEKSDWNTWTQTETVDATPSALKPVAGTGPGICV